MAGSRRLPRLSRGQRTGRNFIIFFLALALWWALPRTPLWMVAEELAAHLEDKTSDLQRIFPDMTEAEARDRAISEMGNVTELGKELAKIHKPWLGWLWAVSCVLLWIAGIMFALGILVLCRLI